MEDRVVMGLIVFIAKFGLGLDSGYMYTSRCYSEQVKPSWVISIKEIICMYIACIVGDKTFLE